MNVEELREYCLSLPLARENMPFAKHGYADLVTFTVADKWFCLLDLQGKRINVKCDPDVGVDMRDKYQGNSDHYTNRLKTDENSGAIQSPRLSLTDRSPKIVSETDFL